MSDQNAEYGVSEKIVFLAIFGLIAVASGVFIYMGYQNLGQVSSQAYDSELISSPMLVEVLRDTETPKSLVVYAALESDVMRLRHHRVVSFLVTRTWLRFVSAIFGSILISIGALFVLAQVRGERANLDISTGGWSAALSTTSPGIFLATLGAVLIALPLIAGQQIETEDHAAYGYFIFADADEHVRWSTLMLPYLQQAPEAAPGRQGAAESPVVPSVEEGVVKELMCEIRPETCEKDEGN